MLSFTPRKKSYRFVLVSALLTAAAIGVALISAVAGQIGAYELAAIGSKAALGLALIIVIYVVPKLAQALNLSSEFSIHLPNAGLLFFALVLLVTILSLSSGNNLLYLVLAVLMATVFVSWVASRMNLHRIKVSLRFPNHIFAGEPVSFDVTVANRKRLLPSFSLTAAMWEQESAPPAEDAVAAARLTEIACLPVVPARTEVRSRIERSFPARGVYPVNGIVVRTRFPFGFIEQRRNIDKTGEIVVYPQPVDLEEFRHLLPWLHGRVESRVKGSGSDLYSIRTYLASDHHHHIDWKATAKTSRLMVREFTRDDDWRVMVVFDPRVGKEMAGAPGFEQRFERAITLAASLTSRFIREGAEVRLTVGAGDTGFGIGREHGYRLLDQLARIKPVPDGEGPDAPELRRPAEDLIRIVIASAARNLVSRTTSRSTQFIDLEEV